MLAILHQRFWIPDPYFYQNKILQGTLCLSIEMSGFRSFLTIVYLSLSVMIGGILCIGCTAASINWNFCTSTRCLWAFKILLFVVLTDLPHWKRKRKEFSTRDEKKSNIQPPIDRLSGYLTYTQKSLLLVHMPLQNWCPEQKATTNNSAI